jgi:hypothetical protein
MLALEIIFLGALFAVVVNIWPWPRGKKADSAVRMMQ